MLGDDENGEEEGEGLGVDLVGVDLTRFVFVGVVDPVVDFRDFVGVPVGVIRPPPPILSPPPPPRDVERAGRF